MALLFQINMYTIIPKRKNQIVSKIKNKCTSLTINVGLKLWTPRQQHITIIHKLI